MFVELSNRSEINDTTSGVKGRGEVRVMFKFCGRNDFASKTAGYDYHNRGGQRSMHEMVSAQKGRTLAYVLNTLYILLAPMNIACKFGGYVY